MEDYVRARFNTGYSPVAGGTHCGGSGSLDQPGDGTLCLPSGLEILGIPRLTDGTVLYCTSTSQSTEEVCPVQLLYIVRDSISCEGGYRMAPYIQSSTKIL
jgi:hypothetical protein